MRQAQPVLVEKHPTNRRNGELVTVSPFLLAACVILAAVHENGMKSLHPRIAQETTAPLQNPASVPRSARHPRSLPEKDSPSRSAETSGNPKHSHQCEHGPATHREPKPNTAREKSIREPRMQPPESPERSPGKDPADNPLGSLSGEFPLRDANLSVAQWLSRPARAVLFG